MPRVLRWGRSAYETADDLARERAAAAALGLDWSLDEGRSAPADLDRADLLVVTSGVRVTGDVLARLRGDVVLTTTSGYDHVDVAACRAAGKVLLRLPEARRDAVVEHAVGSLIRLMRALPALEAEARADRWARAALPELSPRGLHGARVVVVGLGVIGRRAAEVLRAFGAVVVTVDPHAADADAAAIDDVLADADAVTLHCSLTPSSRGLLSAERLDRLAPHAVVVNTARGEVLDVEAAVARVADGRLRGLSADVFPVEPYPRLAAGAALPGVMFTPHAAGFTHDLGRRVADGVAAVLGAWRAGAPLPHRVV